MSTSAVSADIEAWWADLYAGLRDLRGLGRSARCLPYVVLLGALRYLPRGVARGTGRELGRAAYLVLRGRRGRSIENVLAAFPGAERGWAAGVVLRSMEGLGVAFAEAAALGRLSREDLLLRTEVVGAGNLEGALEARSGVVLASAHMGCWELLPAYLAARGRRVAVLARPQAGRWESELLRAERARLGVEEIGPGVASLRRAVRILEGRGIVVCPFDRGLVRAGGVEGTGGGLSVPDLGVKLAAMTGSVVLPARALISAERDVLVFERALTVERETGLEGPSRDLQATVSRWVSETPEQWVWLDGRRPPRAEV